MENFICENPILMQDGAGFGFKAWIFPIFILCGGLMYTLVWMRPNELHKRVAPKYPWASALMASLIFIGLSNFIINDGAMKSHALETGNHSTIVGQVIEIEPIYVYPSYSGVDSIRFSIKGTLTNRGDRVFKLNGQNHFSSVRTKKSFIGVGGKTCFGTKCGLKTNDTVRIKVNDLKTGSIRDTLSIEKCEMP